MTSSAIETRNGQAPLLWTATAIVGLGLVALMVWFAGVLPVQTCSSAPLAQSPLAAFQAARTLDDIWAVFGADPSPCRAALLTSMDQVNRADLFAYIPAAGLFLAGFLLSSRRPKRMAFVWLGLAAVLVAVIGDVVETTSQLSITAQLASAPAVTPAMETLISLHAGYLTKIWALSVGFIAAAALWVGRGVLGTIFAAFLLAPVVLRIFVVFIPDLSSLWSLVGLIRIPIVVLAAIGLAIAGWIARARRSTDTV